MDQHLLQVCDLQDGLLYTTDCYKQQSWPRLILSSSPLCSSKRCSSSSSLLQTCMTDWLCRELEAGTPAAAEHPDHTHASDPSLAAADLSKEEGSAAHVDDTAR